MIPSKWVVVQMDMRKDICTVALQAMYDGFLEHSGRGVEDNHKTRPVTLISAT